MFKWMLFTLISLNLFALEVSLTSAKEDFEKYSTLHIKNYDNFLCQEIKDDFDEVTKIVCAFSKQPSQKFNKLQNDFFEIDTQVKKKTFFLIIKPHQKIKLYPIIFDLTKESKIFNPNIELSNHWMVVGYKDKLPFIKKEDKSDVAINFPFETDKGKLPYVGGLDIKGNPVNIQKVSDVSDYLHIKRYYEDGKYESCLYLIDEVTYRYPNSLFNSELMYYKIKVFDQMEESDRVIQLSKIFLREYSSDENVPEVLAMIAKAYALTGLSSDADYFFDRLFSEHPDSLFYHWGNIYKGEMLESSGSSEKALTYYKKALHETDNIDIAATAAYKLAQNYITNSKIDEASEYAMKIVNANPSFFMSKYESSINMMDSFADSKNYATAAGIAKSIMHEISPKDEERERLLKDIGVWLSKTDKKLDALDSLNTYLKDYSYGIFEEEVTVAKDSLFFDTSEANLSAKISQFDELKQTYKGDSIGNRAIYEKAKLLLENKMYKDVLLFENDLLSLDEQEYPEIKNLITDSAKGAMKDSLLVEDCQDVLELQAKYSLKLSQEWDDGVYECSIKGSNFELAKQIAAFYLNSKDMKERKKWLYNFIRIDFAKGNYSDVIEASKDLIALIEDDIDSKYKDIYRMLFDSYQGSSDKKNMVLVISKLESIFPQDYKDIERYVSVMAIGSENKDDIMVIKYAKEVVKIQQLSNSYTQSPFVEFTLYQSYVNRDEFNEALEILKSLDNRELSKDQRARQKYLLGTIYEKLWRNDNAQEAYQMAIEVSPESAWAKLAKSAKESY